MSKQPTPQPPGADTDEVNRVAHLVFLLERFLRRELSVAVTAHGLTMQQYAALLILDNCKEISNAALAKRSFMTPQSANEMVKALEAKGLIVREPDRNHGRIIHIRISTAGKRALRKADAAVVKVEQRLLAPIVQTDRLQFRNNLIACIAALNPATLDEFRLDTEL